MFFHALLPILMDERGGDGGREPAGPLRRGTNDEGRTGRIPSGLRRAAVRYGARASSGGPSATAARRSSWSPTRLRRHPSSSGSRCRSTAARGSAPASNRTSSHPWPEAATSRSPTRRPGTSTAAAHALKPLPPPPLRGHVIGTRGGSARNRRPPRCGHETSPISHRSVGPRSRAAPGSARGPAWTLGAPSSPSGSSPALSDGPGEHAVRAAAAVRTSPAPARSTPSAAPGATPRLGPAPRLMPARLVCGALHPQVHRRRPHRAVRPEHPLQRLVPPRHPCVLVGVANHHRPARPNPCPPGSRPPGTPPSPWSRSLRQNLPAVLDANHDTTG